MGGVIYHVMMALVILTALRLWRVARRPVTLALVGVIGANFGFWIGGGLYAISSIVWLCICVADRLLRDSAAAQAAPAAAR